MKDLECYDEEQTTVNDLIEKMDAILAETTVEGNGFTYTKEQIRRHFAGSFTITENYGRENVVTKWNTASTILSDFHKSKKQQSPES